MLKNIKRAAAAILLFALLISLCACGGKTEPETDGSKPTVVATIFPYYDFVRSVCGTNVNVVMLVPPGTDSHSYEPTPKDVAQVHDCDLFIYTGGEEDGAFEEMLASADEPVNSLRLIDCVQPLYEQATEGMQGEVDGGYDPHIWTAPANAQLICRAITDAVKQILPELHTSTSESYLRELEFLDRDYTEYFAAHPEPLIFGDRFPFRYLTAEYGVAYYAAFPGCADYTEPSAKTVRTLIEKARENGVSVIWHAEGADTSAAESIAAELGGMTALLHSCHRITREELDAGISYLSLMRQNLDTLRKLG